MRALMTIALGLASFAWTSAAWSASTCLYPVEVFSDPARSAAGDLSPSVLFADVARSSRAVGYGVAAGRADEITVADGRIHLVRPDGKGGVQARHDWIPGEGALMLQLVPVRAWRDATRLSRVASLDDLAAQLDRAVERAGCAAGAKLAFRIEGRVQAATWSTDTLPDKAEVTTSGQRAVIVGLYATREGERHAIPATRRFHAHIVFPDLDVAGHLRAVAIDDGARLRLQAR